MTCAFVFPGQGSQTVGMGKQLSEAFSEARYVFEEIDDVLGQHLSDLIFNGPIETLTLTENAQPALMAVSLAVWKVLEKQGPKDTLPDYCSFIAGHSLGEYSALTAAGTFSLSDATKLLRTRGKAMQEAVPAGSGSMVALLGCDTELAQKIADEATDGETCQIANDNAPGQIVLSGSADAINRAIAIATNSGKKAVALPVSAPFHSALMRPAQDVMEEALANTTMANPSVPLVANVTAATTQDADTIRKLLVEQVTGQVRWRESIEHMQAQGVTHIVELGAGKVLCGLAKRIAQKIQSTSLQTPEDIEAFIRAQEDGIQPEAAAR